MPVYFSDALVLECGLSDYLTCVWVKRRKKKPQNRTKPKFSGPDK